MPAQCQYCGGGGSCPQFFISGQCYEGDCVYKRDNRCTIGGKCPQCNGVGQT